MARAIAIISASDFIVWACRILIASIGADVWAYFITVAMVIAVFIGVKFLEG